MTFEDIKRVNESIRTMKIARFNKKTGKTIEKDYAEVNQRVKAFRMLYPAGTIKTELISHEDGMYIVQAFAFDEDMRFLSSGLAYEVEGSSDINRTSALENCETSAVGRALGFLGIGIDTSIASYEEVLNAQMKQDGLQLATSTEKAGLIASANAKGMDVETILKKVGFDRNRQPEGMNVEQYAKAMEIINKGGDNA